MPTQSPLPARLLLRAPVRGSAVPRMPSFCLFGLSSDLSRVRPRPWILFLKLLDAENMQQG